VKAPKFKYVRVASVDEAVTLLDQYGDEARILAGGQSLMPTLNMRLSRPEILIDINRLDALKGISLAGGTVRIGALARHVEVLNSPIVAKSLPLIAEAMPHVAHVAVRNRGTFGGSIAHNDPAAEWPMMALLLDAELKTHRARGGRTIPIRDFLVTYLTTALEENEILTEIRLPGLPPGSGWGFEELSRRPGDFALAAVAALVSVEKGVCKEARISMAGVGPTALRAPQAEGMLRGQRLEPELLKQAAARAGEAADPSNDVHASADYRRHLVTVLTRRALEAAARRAA
jgi:carbon-monoxide dehydrogenase medium subunit